MKSFMKKVIMGALALAIVVSSIVSRPEVVKAGIKADGTGWDDDDIWVFKIIPTDEILILTKIDVSKHWPGTVGYNAKLLYDTFGYNEPAELFIDEYAYAFSDDDPRVKTVKIETECADREGFSNPAGVLKIGGYAFYACHALTEIKCQSNVKIKTIDQCAFEFCGELKTIDLTEVENIGNEAFYECEYLEKIKFNEIESIGDSAFYNCRSLQEVDFGDWEAGTCSIAANAFAGVGVDGGANNPVLLLPADWKGGEPDEYGEWNGGYFRYVKSMSITDETIILTEGEDKQLTAEASPIESENKAVTWSSSDKSVATVDENGKVTAVSVGNATIKVTSAIDERKTATCGVTVNHDFSEQPYKVTEDKTQYYQECKYCEAKSIPKKTGDIVGEDLDEKTEANIASGEVWLTGVRDVTYSGSVVTFDIRAYKGNKLLKEGTDYTIKYTNNKKACRDYSERNAANFPTVTLTGKGAYRDVKVTKTFKIEPIDINAEETFASNAVVEVKNTSYKPIPTLSVNGKKLKYKTDYIVVYDSAHATGFNEVGDYLIKLEGIGNYRGTVVSSFKIVNKNEYSILSKASVTGYAKRFIYDGNAKEQNKSEVVVKVKAGKATETLKEGIDYTIAYLNNIDVGTASMIIKAVPGNTKYIGEKVINYKITGTPLSKARVTYEKNQTYSGVTVKPAVTRALANGAKLVEGTDYTLEYKKNVNAGIASIIIMGKGAYTGTVKKTFRIKPAELKNEAPFTVEIKSVLPKNEKGAYTVEVEVKNNGKLLVKGIDYTLSYKNNKKAGKSDDNNAPAVMIKGKGNYSKNIIRTFSITE